MAPLIHGDARQGQITREYRIWCLMKARCYNTEFPKYSAYGARGIRVCPRWLESFASFLADMGRCPPDCSIERNDNDGDYTPDNCRWATRKEQARNTRKNILVTIDGRTQPASAWAEEVGLPHDCLYQRLNRLGWTPERAILTPKLATGRQPKQIGAQR